jgi:hypothetical protein
MGKKYISHILRNGNEKGKAQARRYGKEND